QGGLAMRLLPRRSMTMGGTMLYVSRPSGVCAIGTDIGHAERICRVHDYTGAAVKRPLVVAMAFLLGGIAVNTQTALGPEDVALRTEQALLALDRYLETWNSRDPRI